jgi:ribosomal protein RSM22 (predicted rRNA methylase)
MSLPEELKLAIAHELGHFSKKAVTASTDELSKRYRGLERHQGAFITSDAQRSAYLLSRLPATYAAIRRVFLEIRERIPEIGFDDLVDLGGGHGAVLWAASEVFPTLQKATIIEQDQGLIVTGKKLAQSSSQNIIKTATWCNEDLLKLESFHSADLVVMSYALGELPENSHRDIVQKMWCAAKKAVVLIEPGTMAGFERIREARSELIALGGYLVAPCPHALACPMPPGDWCHFSERLERTREHRIAKQGTLGYEDEKYSYVVAAKFPVVLPEARVLRHPLKRSGHVHLTLCTPEGLQHKTLSRRDGDLYKKARKLEWGSIF